MKFYTGIGSRQTPQNVLIAMTEIAKELNKKGYCLRSGGAGGADTAFENGSGSNKEIFIPWYGFSNRRNPKDICNPHTESMELAESLHPAWFRCSQGARKLHARNTQQILGEYLNSPSDFVICWTPNGEQIGGTATAIRLAKNNGIPVYNLFGINFKEENFLKEYVQTIITCK